MLVSVKMFNFIIVLGGNFMFKRNIKVLGFLIDIIFLINFKCIFMLFMVNFFILDCYGIEFLILI